MPTRTRGSRSWSSARTGCHCPDPAVAIDAILDGLRGTDAVFWLTIRPHPDHPERQAEINAAIRAAASRRSNVRVVDVAAAFEGHPEWVDPDGVHFTEAGRLAFALLLADAVGPAPG